MRNRCSTRDDAATVSDRFSAFAPLLGLHQQALQVLPAALPPLLATERRRKVVVKIQKQHPAVSYFLDGPLFGEVGAQV